MADISTQSVIMAANPRAIMDAIADVGAYPQWTGAIKQVDITEPGSGGRPRRVQFTMDAGMIKDTYELEYDWAPDGLSVSWQLVSSKLQKGQQGSYTLTTLPSGTEVTYRLAVQLTIPLIGALRRNAEKTIMDTALRELRTLVEKSAAGNE